MKNKFWLCKRGNVFYSFDSETGIRKSLGTNDRNQAKRLIAAKDDAIRQPAINLAIAKAYLVGVDPKLVERTWQTVIDEYSSKGSASSRSRVKRAFKNAAFDLIRHKRVVETVGDDFRAVLRASGAYSQHMLRRLQNLALDLGWLLVPVIPAKLWPEPKSKPRRAITFEEHQRIVQRENQEERKNYYQLLWEIGSAQTDAANLCASNLDWDRRELSFRRQKTGEFCILQIGPRLEALLKRLPAAGPLFPGQIKLEAKDRSAEFRRRCRTLKIEGISLHSYRYAWAERAKCLGMPERFAQTALGHLAARMQGAGRIVERNGHEWRDAIGAGVCALAVWRVTGAGVDGQPETLAARVAWRAVVRELSRDWLGESVSLSTVSDDWLWQNAEQTSESRAERAARLEVERAALGRKALLLRRLDNLPDGRGRRAETINKLQRAATALLDGAKLDACPLFVFVGGVRAIVWSQAESQSFE